MNETEVREKVVLPWLKRLGFTANNLAMEKTFKIQMGLNVLEVGSGRKRRNISGRADYLIRVDDLNLFIIEVKAEDETVGEETIDQAVSYGRLVVDGNMPPLAIITNGNQTIIVDILSKKILDDSAVLEHRFFKNGYRISCDSEAYSEALSYLISLSSENLLVFCKHQVAFRMQPLKGEEIDSGKKYIPQLYIQREKPEREIHRLLFSKESETNVVLLTGLPQLGKTSFLCHLAEDLLNANIPCLFYPAIGIKRGIFKALEEDFKFDFKQEINAPQLIARLSKILGGNEQLVLIIDGLNEIDKERAYQICAECERLSISSIKIIICATANSLNRLLLENDNPTYICERLGLKKKDLALLKFKSLKDLSRKNIVQIDEFNIEETSQAVEVYSKAFNVKMDRSPIPTVSNPFILRSIAELYMNSKVPGILDNATIVSNNLYRKLNRIDIEKIEGKELLYRLGKCIYEEGAPISFFKDFTVAFTVVFKLIDAAVIAETHNAFEEEGLDFYYSRERDYTISHIVCNWPLTFESLSDLELVSEIENACRTIAGKESLRWFLGEPTAIHFLKRSYDHCKDEIIREEVLLAAILRQNFDTKEDVEWFEKIIYEFSGGELEEILEDEVNTFEAATILYKAILSTTFYNIISGNQIRLIKFLLLLEGQAEDYELQESYSLELLQGDLFYDLFVDKLFVDDDPRIARAVSLILAHYHILPDCMSLHLSTKNTKFLKNKLNYIEALAITDDNISDADSYCGVGLSHGADTEAWISELRGYEDHWGEIIRFYRGLNVLPYVKGVIKSLKEEILKQIGDRNYFSVSLQDLLIDLEDDPILDNPNQLRIPFNDSLEDGTGTFI